MAAERDWHDECGRRGHFFLLLLRIALLFRARMAEQTSDGAQVVQLIGLRLCIHRFVIGLRSSILHAFAGAQLVVEQPLP